MYYVFGDYTLDTELRELRCRGSLIKLPPKPFTLLEYLIVNRHSVVTHDNANEYLYPNEFVANYGLFACIRDARKAIGDDKRARSDRYIQNMNGYGYRFVAEVQEQMSPAPRPHLGDIRRHPPEQRRIQELIENMRGKEIHVQRIAPTIAAAPALVSDVCELLCAAGKMERISEDRYRHRY